MIGLSKTIEQSIKKPTIAFKEENLMQGCFTFRKKKHNLILNDIYFKFFCRPK